MRLSLVESIRFASGRQADSDDHNSARMEQSTRLGTVQLGRGKISLFGQIMNCINKDG
jgi:hypothetical protein